MGLPICFPLAFAFSIPLLTRWLVMFRSISLNTPIILSIPSVIGSSALLQSTTKLPSISFRCFSFANSIISQSCFVLRVIRLTSVAATVSPEFTAESSLFSSARSVFAPLSYSRYIVSSDAPCRLSSRTYRLMSCIFSFVEHRA